MPCCEKVGLKKGPWTPEEDKKLVAYVEEHGPGNWRSVPAKAGNTTFLLPFFFFSIYVNRGFKLRLQTRFRFCYDP